MTLPRWCDAHSAAVMPINCKTRLSSAGLAPFPADGVASPAVAMALHPFALPSGRRPFGRPRNADGADARREVEADVISRFGDQDN
jgi:hypothetical protein